MSCDFDGTHPEFEAMSEQDRQAQLLSFEAAFPMDEPPEARGAREDALLQSLLAGNSSQGMRDLPSGLDFWIETREGCVRITDGVSVFGTLWQAARHYNTLKRQVTGVAAGIDVQSQIGVRTDAGVVPLRAHVSKPAVANYDHVSAETLAGTIVHTLCKGLQLKFRHVQYQFRYVLGPDCVVVVVRGQLLKTHVGMTAEMRAVRAKYALTKPAQPDSLSIIICIDDKDVSPRNAMLPPPPRSNVSGEF